MIFRPRQAARALGRVILKSLQEHPSEWEDDKQIMSKNGVDISQERGFFRVFDRIVIDYKYEDVWVPFIQRLRIRRAYRAVMATSARHALLKPERKAEAE